MRWREALRVAAAMTLAGFVVIAALLFRRERCRIHTAACDFS
jgi:hypothetical protein